MANGNWLTHVTAGKGLSTVIPNLRVGYYQFRVRAEIGESVSEWATISHRLAPPGFLDTISGLQLDGGGLMFSGRDPVFKWNSIFEEAQLAAENGVEYDTEGLPFVFKDYLVEILDDQANVIRAEAVADPTYTYTYEKNANDAAALAVSARRAFTVSVRARGRQGQESLAETIFVSNPQPTRSGALKIEQSTAGCSITFPHNSDLDFAGYRVWVKETNDIDPLGDPHLDVQQNGVFVPIPQGQTRYMRYAPFDVFSNETSTLDIADVTMLAATDIEGITIDDGSIDEAKLSPELQARLEGAEAMADEAAEDAIQALEDIQGLDGRLALLDEPGGRVETLEIEQEDLQTAVTQAQQTGDNAQNVATSALQASNDNALSITNVVSKARNLEQSLVPSAFDSLFNWTSDYSDFGDADTLDQNSAITQITDDPDYGICIEINGTSQTVNFISPQRINHDHWYELQVRFKVVSAPDDNCRFRAQFNTFAADGSIIADNSQLDFGDEETQPVYHTAAQGDHTATLRFRGANAPAFDDWSGAAASLAESEKFIRAGFKTNSSGATSATIRVASVEWADITPVQKSEFRAFQAFTASQENATLIQQVQATAGEANTKATQALEATSDQATLIQQVQATANSAGEDATEALNTANTANGKATQALTATSENASLIQQVEAIANDAEAVATSAINVANNAQGQIAEIDQIARVGGFSGSLVPNPFFNFWDDGATYPAGYTSGVVPIRAPGGVFGRYAMRVTGSAGSTASYTYASNQPGLTSGKLILRCAAKRITGSFNGAAGFVRYRSAAGTDLGYEFINLATDADTRGYAGNSGSDIRVWEKEITAPVGTVRHDVFAMAHWAGAAGGVETANLIEFHMLDVVPQPHGSAQAGLALSATQSIEGKLSASIALTTDVNGRITGVKALDDGTTGSLIFRADQLYMFNGVSNAPLFEASGGVVRMPNVEVGNLKVIQGGANQNGKIHFDNGVTMKVTGLGFGTNNQFLEWFGPSMPINQCSEANGTRWEKVDGSAYFGGSLTAGTLTNKVTSSAKTTGPYSVDTNVFGSNGGTIEVVMSFSTNWSQSTTQSSDPGEANGAGNIVIHLQRSYGGGFWTTVATLTVRRSWTRTTDQIGGSSWLVIRSAGGGGSVTFTDPDNSTVNRQYRASVASYNLAGQGGVDTQLLSIVAVEE